MRRTPTADDAADAVAETFTVAWIRLDDIPDRPEALFWLYATARQVLADGRRSRDRRDRLIEGLGQELARLGAGSSPPPGEALWWLRRPSGGCSRGIARSCRWSVGRG